MSKAKTKASEEFEDPIRVETILTITIFGHGREYTHPYGVISPVGNFYKNQVRVFSQARVPDMTCIMEDEQNPELLEELVQNMRVNQTSETNAILQTFMECKKPEYMDFLQPENVLEEFRSDPTLSRTLKHKYKKKTCGTMVYLSNKHFEFGSEFMEGIFLIDVRVKNTYSNGYIDYQSVFTPKINKPVNLSSLKGLRFLFGKILKKTPEIMKQIKNDKMLTKINLNILYDLFKGIDYVNILDYTCRSAMKRLTGRKISYLYDLEKEAADELPSFGGRRTRKNK